MIGSMTGGMVLVEVWKMQPSVLSEGKVQQEFSYYQVHQIKIKTYQTINYLIHIYLSFKTTLLNQ